MFLDDRPQSETRGNNRNAPAMYSCIFVGNGSRYADACRNHQADFYIRGPIPRCSRSDALVMRRSRSRHAIRDVRAKSYELFRGRVVSISGAPQRQFR